MKGGPSGRPSVKITFVASIGTLIRDRDGVGQRLTKRCRRRSRGDRNGEIRVRDVDPANVRREMLTEPYIAIGAQGDSEWKARASVVSEMRPPARWE